MIVSGGMAAFFLGVRFREAAFLANGFFFFRGSFDADALLNLSDRS